MSLHFSRSKDYRKVPIATAPDDQEPWLGSDVIIEKLLERNPDIPKGMSLDEFSKSASAQEWSSFATEELASLLYPNMCRTLGDSFRAFGYVDKVDSFSTLDKYAVKGLGSLAMYMAASRVKSTFFSL